MDQVFAERQIVEKYLGKGKDVFWAFMDLEKAYDRIDREALWKVLRLYGVGGRLLNAVKSFYVNSRACVIERHRVNEASKCLGVLKSRYLGMNEKRRLYEGVIVPTALYGAETWNIKKDERNKLDVIEMRCLRSMLGVSRMDWLTNVEVKRRTGVVRKLSDRVDQSVLRWYEHMVRMDEKRQIKKVWRALVTEGRRRGRPNLRWMDGVWMALEV